MPRVSRQILTAFFLLAQCSRASPSSQACPVLEKTVSAGLARPTRCVTVGACGRRALPSLRADVRGQPPWPPLCPVLSRFPGPMVWLVGTVLGRDGPCHLAAQQKVQDVPDLPPGGEPLRQLWCGPSPLRPMPAHSLPRWVCWWERGQQRGTGLPGEHVSFRLHLEATLRCAE